MSQNETPTFRGLPALTPARIETRAQELAAAAAELPGNFDGAADTVELAALQVAATMLLFRETRRLADAVERVAARM